MKLDDIIEDSYIVLTFILLGLILLVGALSLMFPGALKIALMMLFY